MSKVLTFVEIDIPTFDSPDVDQTLRFTYDASFYLGNPVDDIDAIPSIKDIDFSPAIISLGSDLGQRATVTVKFKDHRHIFSGETFTSGSFWGKFRARYGLKLRSRPLRLIRGLANQTLASMETRHYVIESTDGPASDGEYRIIAKDALKLADGDRAQAPVLSNGFLASNITNASGTLTLAPSGIGDAEYPASGYVAIGGKEIVGFTRSSDTLTISRAEYNTEAVAHTAQDRIQLCLVYSGGDVANIINDLFVNYASVDSSLIPLATWQNETATYLNTVYSALIAEPTSVNKLVSELIEQAGLAVWWNDLQEQIQLQVLRSISTASGIYNGENIIADSLDVREQPDKRLSQVYTYFGKINPLVNEDQINNYRSTALTIETQAEIDYGSPAIKKIYSRWIAAGGRAVADRLNEILLGRFRDPPRRFNFDLLRYSVDNPVLGAGYQLGGWAFQDETGAAELVPIQLTSIRQDADRHTVEAEEMLFQSIGADSPDVTNRIIIFDSNINDVNLRSVHDSIYSAPQSGDVVDCYVQSGVTIGQSSAGAAFNVGTWPAGVTINIIMTSSRIQGQGGAAGSGGSGNGNNGNPGAAGGIALYTRQAINLTSTTADIWGGGGGGGGGGVGVRFDVFAGGGGGGGGAGTTYGAGASGGAGVDGSGGQPGSPGSGGNSGSNASGGAGGAGGVVGTSLLRHGGNGGTGGSPGSNGNAGGNGETDGIQYSATSGGAGGAAGSSIDGISFVTHVGAAGSLLGPQVN